MDRHFYVILRQVDIHGQLKQMMSEEAEFRGTQEVVMGDCPWRECDYADYGHRRREEFVVYVTGVCSPDVVTIVRRFMKCGIEAHVWDSRQGPSSINRICDGRISGYERFPRVCQPVASTARVR